MSTSVQFLLKRRTAAVWESTNPSLAQGEPGVELDTGRIKIGNGSSWKSTPYASNIRTDTAAGWAASTIRLGTGEIGYASDTGRMKVGNNSSTFSQLPEPSLINDMQSFVNAAQAASASASTTKLAADNALAAAAVGSVVTGDTIAAGRNGVSDGNYFWVRPVAASGLTRFTSFQRTTASQVLVGTVPSGTEFDRINTDYTLVGGNFITNSTFALNTADTGQYTTPIGYSYNLNQGGGKIVTKPNTVIGSTNALEFSFKTNASSAGYSSDLTQLQLKQTVAIPTGLIATGSTNRLIYSIQLNSTASTAITSTSMATMYIFTGTVTSAVGNGSSITYNFASDILLANGTLLTCESIPNTGGSNLTFGSPTAITVAADKRSFSVPITGITGTAAGLAKFSLLSSTTAKIQDLSATGSTNWQQIVTDAAIPAGFNAVEPVIRVSSSTLGAIIWITGICSVFNRPTLFTYDKNHAEEISPLATTVDTVSKSEPLTAPWDIGTNIAPNSLLNADAPGTATPTGYAFLSGGSGVAATVRSVESCPLTPFKTNTAFRMTHFNDGTTRTDGQLGTSVSVPTILRDIAFTVRCVYYTNVQDSRITSSMVAYRNSDGGSTTGVVISKISTDGAANTWFPVVHNVTFTAVAGTNSVYLRFVRQQGGVAGASWLGSPAAAFSWITGVSFGFNRTNTVYDRNLTAEITAIANTAAAQAVASAVPQTVDQYFDASGFSSPIIPIERIIAWGDSLTAAGYLAKVLASFSSAGTTRTGLVSGIGGESSIEILNRVNGYSFFRDSPSTVDYRAGEATTLRARRAQPARLVLNSPTIPAQNYVSSWIGFGQTIAEPRLVNFYNNGTIIGTSYTRLSAVSSVTSGSSTLTATGHPFRTNDIVHFIENISLTNATISGTNIFRGKHYFVTKVTDNTYTLSETSGGAAITFNLAGTVKALGDFTLNWRPADVSDSNAITTRTYTDRDTSTGVLWMGANNITGASIKTDIEAAFSHFKTLGKHVIIMTPIIGIDAPAANVSARADVGDWILSTYPDNSIDIWAILRTRGDGSAGDASDIAIGGTPRSLRSDTIHLTDAGYTIVANEVYNFLRARSW